MPGSAWGPGVPARCGIIARDAWHSPQSASAAPCSGASPRSAVTEAAAAGGAVRVDGEMVDAPVVARATDILRRKDT